jgi:regulator of protease activity HflC (stomatin/prohibitin superfamily)
MSSVDAGQEGVVVKKPWFVGASGVMPTPVQTGTVWRAPTTDVLSYDVRPYRLNEQFHDLITSDNVPVSFDCSISVHAIPGKTPILHEKFGQDWYVANIQPAFRTMVRDFARGHKVFELTTDPAVTTQGQMLVKDELDRLIVAKGIPAQIDQLVIGSVTPPKEVLDETARTAAQDQRARTEAKRAIAEVARREAEENKAIADRAYATKFGMTPQEFLTYRSLEIQREMVEVVKDKQNVNVLVSTGHGAEPMFNVGK